MILLDTNVISEIHASNPNPKVLAWFEAVADQSLYLSAITEAELWSGIAAMADGKAKATKAAVIAELLQEDFADRLLPFESRAARAFGEIFQRRKRLNGKDDPVDCQIAAIAKVHGLKLATRNVKDFDGCGIEIINPWDR